MIGKKITSLLLILSVAVGGLLCPVSAEKSATVDMVPSAENNVLDNDAISLFLVPSYADFIAGHADAPSPHLSIVADNHQLVGYSEGNVELKEHLEKTAAIVNKNDSYLEYEINAEQAGLYSIRVTYAPTVSKSTAYECSVIINGTLPFKSASDIQLNRKFYNKSEITQDKKGNDVRPEQAEDMNYRTFALKDSRGVFSDPLQFYLQQGSNRVRLEFTQGNVAVEKVEFYNDSAVPKYQEYRGQTAGKVNAAPFEPIYRQAEEAKAITHTVLYPTYDKSSGATVPSDPAKLRLNTIGQGTWKMPGQSIEWEIDVPEDGYYNLGMRARQNYVRGFYSSRNIYIDDQLLFDEMKNVEFSYQVDWYIKVLGDDTPYLFYLEKGLHTIRMEAVPGIIGEFVSELEEIIFDLNTIYRKMIMVTGVTPDMYRDYQLEKDIPGLLESFDSLASRLRAMKKAIEKTGVKKGSEAVVAEKLAIQLDSFIDKPDTVPLRLEDFRNNISALSSWVGTLKEQPLELDYLFLKHADAPLPKANNNFFQQFSYRFMAFISSFVEDYSYVSDESENGSNLSVWVNLGRDQAQIIKDLAENYFTPQTDININISLVQMGLVEAIAAGKGPDIALYTGMGDSVNLAARGALQDLSKDPNYKEITSRFHKNSMRPFLYNDGAYGYPIQQSFYMMFYRKDIFDELELSPPKTWDEFYRALTVISKKKLLVGVPVGSATIPDNTMFDVLLYQNDGDYYNKNQTQTLFDSDAALKAFTQWTEFYSKYSLPLTYDFYNRFRSGEMPLGFADYSVYNQLSVAAPEIDGLWEMLPMPGTVQKDGTVNDTISGGVSGCIMLKKAKNKEAGYQFLDWFTSAKIQSEYGLAVENILGQGGRYNPANMEAIRMMNWSDKEADMLIGQMNKLQLTEQIPASYFVTRSLTNAFRSVVIRYENPRESLITYNNDINAEIKRKRKEMKLD